MIDLLVLVIAGGLGWSLARAALCAVAATQEAVQSQRAVGLGMQLVAMSTTATVLTGPLPRTRPC